MRGIQASQPSLVPSLSPLRPSPRPRHSPLCLRPKSSPSLRLALVLRAGRPRPASPPAALGL